MSLHFFLWMENSHIFEMMYHMSCEKDQNIGFDISQEASALSTYAKKVDAMCVTRSVGARCAHARAPRMQDGALFADKSSKET